MSTLHIFKTGTHTDMHGNRIQFSEAAVAAMVQAYDPALYDAPIVIGHPALDAPAYGWVKSLVAQGTDVLAEPQDVDPAFAELVAQKRYKNISACSYSPDAPGNPKPGNWYLRHIGFLGAQPPAIKGLKPAAFSEAEEDVVEFADWNSTNSASLFARLRDFLIEKFGREATEAVLPAWQIDARRDAVQESDSVRPAFTENTPAAPASPTPSIPPTIEDNTVDEKETLRLAQENADLKRQLEARRQADSQAEQRQRHEMNAAFADSLVSEVRLAPAAKNVVVALLDAVECGDSPVAFSEGSLTQPLGEAFRHVLKTSPPLVCFSEVATKARGTPSGQSVEFADADPIALALHQKAQTLATSENISYEAAVKRCL
ncbi:MAG TPA: peptidase [Arsenophonus nasoniae]|uniref:peptidase n=1 Tax=Arsenophonus nasoniae TaxID=638 RepID=UPI003879EE65